MQFDVPQNMNQMGSPLMEKREVCSSLLQQYTCSYTYP